MHTQCALLPFLFSFDPKAAVMALDKVKEAEKASRRSYQCGATLDENKIRGEKGSL